MCKNPTWMVYTLPILIGSVGYLQFDRLQSNEKMSRAVVPTATSGDPVELYKLVTKDIPKAGPGNVVVRMTLRPVNPTDSLVIQWGLWEHLDLDQLVIGSEGTGLVYEVFLLYMQIAFLYRVVQIESFACSGCKIHGRFL